MVKKNKAIQTKAGSVSSTTGGAWVNPLSNLLSTQLRNPNTTKLCNLILFRPD